MASDHLFPSDEHIVAAARHHSHEMKQMECWESISGFPLLQGGQPVAWIKYGDQCLKSEAATQHYIYERLTQEPRLSEIVRVPQVYRVIEDNGNPSVIIVMEYVFGRTVWHWLEKSEERKDILWGQVLSSMHALLALDPPRPTSPPGPVGGGYIAHVVFGEYAETGVAPREFSSVEDLQTYINETIAGKPNFTDVADFKSENLRLCHCDPHQQNFMVANDEGVGPIYMIDFGRCMWLPVSFLKWALIINPRDSIFQYLVKALENLGDIPLQGTNLAVLDAFNRKYYYLCKLQWNGR